MEKPRNPGLFLCLDRDDDRVHVTHVASELEFSKNDPFILCHYGTGRERVVVCEIFFKILALLPEIQKIGCFENLDMLLQGNTMGFVIEMAHMLYCLLAERRRSCGERSDSMA